MLMRQDPAHLCAALTVRLKPNTTYAPGPVRLKPDTTYS